MQSLNLYIASILLPYVPSVFELVQKCLADSDRSESTFKLAIGLLGDLADTFPNGEIKQYLLAEWIASELRTRTRMPVETKKTLRWAREVRASSLLFCLRLLKSLRSGGQAGNGIDYDYFLHSIAFSSSVHVFLTRNYSFSCLDIQCPSRSSTSCL